MVHQDLSRAVVLLVVIGLNPPRCHNPQHLLVPPVLKVSFGSHLGSMRNFSGRTGHSNGHRGQALESAHLDPSHAK